MNAPRSLAFLGCCLIHGVLAGSVLAQPTGVVVVDKFDELPACIDLAQPNIDEPLSVCNVFVEFASIDDNLLYVASSSITTDDPNGFYQHPLGIDSAPAQNFVNFFPDLACDSFMDIGLKVVPPGVTDHTAFDPDWNSDLFNNSGVAAGGWFNAVPPSGQGSPNPVTMQVFVSQFAVRQGFTVSGSFTVFFNEGDTPVPFQFSCFASLPCEDDPALCIDGIDCTADLCDPSNPQADANGCVNPFEPISSPCEADGNPCTVDHCDGAGACVFLENLACDDQDACTTDSCDPASGCVGTPITCDDGNACTVDSCDPVFGCVFDPLSCDDGDACTTDTCDPATGCANDAVVCDDGDLCTTDSCDPASGCVFTPQDCFDDDACTTDICVGGVCFNDPVDCDDQNVCTADTCDPVTGCVNTTIDCGDGNACTADTCDPIAGCMNDAIDCNDGDLCTVDTCDPASGCVNQPLDCFDDDLCTDDFCVDGQCVNPPVDCGDGDACTDDSCDPTDGSCLHDPISCDDANDCTTDSCDPAIGCLNEALGCDDNNVCTVDSCDPSGGCVNTPVDCNDNDPCTVDSCDPVSGCFTQPVDCDDGDACTADSCDPITGECLHDTIVCDDSNLCTTDSCDPAIGCVFDPVDCFDDNKCTADSCDPATGCVNTTIDCNDQDACTADSCDELIGCINDVIDCNDNDACTADSCDSVDGCVNTAISCGDGNACTADTCDPVSGCANTPISCDDDNVCTADSCDTVLGCLNQLIDCGDGNPCTDDLCDAVAGCMHIDNVDPCDDGDACTVGDTCSAGACLGSEVICPGPTGPCDAGQTCDAASGDCVDVPDPPAGTGCELDGDLCTIDACDGAGNCGNVDTVACQAANLPCEGGQFCDSATGGCIDNADAPASSMCEADGDLCTNDHCDGAGNCVLESNVSCPEGQGCENGVCVDLFIDLFLDISPGKCPNFFNRQSNGNSFLTLLGMPGFDISEIDTSTLVLSRTDGAGAPLALTGSTNVGDFGTPFLGELCSCHAVGGDGLEDLRIKAKKPDITTALELVGLPTGTIMELQVTGQLLDGTPFVARDCIILARNANQLP